MQRRQLKEKTVGRFDLKLYGSRVGRLGFAEGVKGGVGREEGSDGGWVVAQQICPASGEVDRGRERKRGRDKEKEGRVREKNREREKRVSYGGMSVMQY